MLAYHQLNKFTLLTFHTDHLQISPLCSYTTCISIMNLYQFKQYFILKMSRNAWAICSQCLGEPPERLHEAIFMYMYM